VTVLFAIVGLLVGLTIGLSASLLHRRPRRSTRMSSTHQILLPFTATTLSRRALEAAIRLAKAE
jgi:NhaP-type Na+/H+ or K+/H+ antiporter